MAAYGALVSVMQILDEIHHHPRPPISIHKQHVESLTVNVKFLQEFLEGYNLHLSYTAKPDPLESRIAEAAYAAEDVIESYIVNQILSRSPHHAQEISSTQLSQEVDSSDKLMIAEDQIILDPPTNDGVKMSCIGLFKYVRRSLKSYMAHKIQQLQEGYHNQDPNRNHTAEPDPLESRIAEAAYSAEDVIVDQVHSRSSVHAQEISSTEFEKGMQKVIEEMDLIKVEIKEKLKKKNGVPIIKKQKTGVGSSRSSSTAQKVGMVGLDDVLIDMLDKITGGGVARQIIPIVGMGGLGKTTLARNIYANPLVKEYFYLCAWSTISQVHNAKRILSEILAQVGVESGGDLSDYELGEKLYKYLIGRRYFIVLDDMWSIEAWDRVRTFFPDNENGSRIVVTTRLSNLASKFNYSDGHDMKFMDDATSWNLFSKTVFGEETCPRELEGIGKKIVEGCKGLPLSIVVVGGILSKCEPTPVDWEVIEKKFNSIVNSVEDGSCLQILYMSYNNLPVHIKPCFLYLAIYEEDAEIQVRILIPVWVAEGFVKPIDGKSLEEAAEEYLEELVARNLILVEKRRYHSRGELREIKMHDMVRDVCLREAQKDKFLCVLGEHSIPKSMSSQRRIICTSKEKYHLKPPIDSLEPISSSLVRTLIGKFSQSLSSFRLSRVCVVRATHMDGEASDKHYEDIRLVNLRFVFTDVYDAYEQFSISRILSPVNFPWNLQTLIILGQNNASYVLDIWKMPLLRHVMCEGYTTTLYVPDPPLSDDDMDEDALKNLHTLFTMTNLNFSDGVLERIPNIRKLKLAYKGGGDYGLHDLRRLHKLQDLCLKMYTSVGLTKNLTLPHSLKKLVLFGTKLLWEDINDKIGCLPLLQVLKLKCNSFTGFEWETVEGQFLSLKFLLIDECNLVHWVTDNTHFPRLEHLVLSGLENLSEIPSYIGDIPTLRSIKVEYCSDSLVESARRILDEQKELGNEDIRIRVRTDFTKPAWFL